MKTLPISVYTFRDYLRVIFRRGHVVTASVIVVTAVTYAGLQMQTPYYEASVKMLITAKKQVEATYYSELSGGSTQEKLAVTQSEIVQSTPVLNRTVDALQLQLRSLDYEKHFASPLKRWRIESTSKESQLDLLPSDEKRLVLTRIALERLKGSVTVEPVRDTNTFDITVRDFDPSAAAVIANTISRSYVIFDLEQQLAELQLKYGGKHPQVVQIRDHINKLYKTLDGTPISNADAIGPASVKIIEQASMPLRPVGKSKKLLLMVAFVMSLALGVIMAFLFEYLDTTFKIPLDIENYLGVPFLGSIPKQRGRRPYFYQNLTEQLYLLMKDKDIKTVLIAPVQSNGTAKACLAELARYMAMKTARRVLLIDGNLRSPGLHKSLKLSDTPGLAEVLEEKADLQGSVKTGGDNLFFLAAGRTKLNPLPLLDTAKMRELMQTVRSQYDLVLIFSPQLEHSKDAVILANYVDAIAVIVDESHTRREVAKASMQSFENMSSRVIGAILNGRTFPIPRFLYGVV